MALLFLELLITVTIAVLKKTVHSTADQEQPGGEVTSDLTEKTNIRVLHFRASFKKTNIQ